MLLYRNNELNIYELISGIYIRLSKSYLNQYLAMNLAYNKESRGRSMKTRERTAKNATIANIIGTNI